mmetsp:Transcript_10043/g.27295  ORF Transcript_10043/g.27295 Transcript_10043/m.27295 type:complete len:295 (-) Transcript_10043:784-1668(-)
MAHHLPCCKFAGAWLGKDFLQLQELLVVDRRHGRHVARPERISSSPRRDIRAHLGIFLRFGVQTLGETGDSERAPPPLALPRVVHHNQVLDTILRGLFGRIFLGYGRLGLLICRLDRPGFLVERHANAAGDVCGAGPQADVGPYQLCDLLVHDVYVTLKMAQDLLSRLQLVVQALDLACAHLGRGARHVLLRNLRPPLLRASNGSHRQLERRERRFHGRRRVVQFVQDGFGCERHGLVPATSSVCERPRPPINVLRLDRQRQLPHGTHRATHNAPSAQSRHIMRPLAACSAPAK